ncbi:helix-hairpin-helix domain-containing protein [Pseudanabaena sp. SR411]|uniref:helix-hairpin-helix domain-containing protein n=1 Tax=Pseudanabaena sp. SR411 TaxID=1980935 RepID=UPI000B9988E5|nr:helix-hairpin-helix domain-containing protein [Pseudanabaena sp. SR411]
MSYIFSLVKKLFQAVIKTKAFLLLFLLSVVGAIAISACTNELKVSNPPTTSAPSTTVETKKESVKDSAMVMPSSSKGKININEAILSELDKVEAKLGIAGLSNKIQAARPYTKIEDLVSKKVITAEQFEQVKDMVSIETVVLTGEAKEVDYLTKLGLMKGHMIVAKELLDLQKPDQALPHIEHPVEEIYADVEAQLQERNVKEFKQSLIDLQQLVKSKPNDPTLAAKYNESIASIDLAIAAIPEAQRQSPKLALQVINSILDTAGTEYMAAIANDKIKEIIEYQDSLGFTIYVEQLYKSIAPTMEKEHPDAHKQFTASLEKLKSAYPSPIAPEKPVLSVADMSALIKTNEQTSAKVYAKQ